jgi:DNA-binding transcriptional ArsR family regulator
MERWGAGRRLMELLPRGQSNCEKAYIAPYRMSVCRASLVQNAIAVRVWRGPIYTLSRIYAVWYIMSMESVFEIIAEPNRRGILNVLATSHQSVGEIARQLRMPQTTVSKHLRVLRESGFVESSVDAQRRFYRLKPEPLQKLDAWLAPFRRIWSSHLDALERHLDRMEPSKPTRPTSTRRKTRRR